MHGQRKEEGLPAPAQACNCKREAKLPTRHLDGTAN
jgi:hypothetical protein